MSFLLEKDEYVIEEVRKHLFVFYAQLAWIIILFFIPLTTYGFIRNFLSEVSGGHPAALFIFFIAIWALILWTAGYYFWTDYYLDVWIITNHRIIDIEQKGFFNREISTFSIDRIEDVTVNVEGILATFIKFGNLHAHTAADSHDFTIPQANDPMHIKDVIMAQARKAKGSLRTNE